MRLATWSGVIETTLVHTLVLFKEPLDIGVSAYYILHPGAESRIAAVEVEGSQKG